MCRFANQTDDDINLYIQYVVNATIDHKYDGNIEGWDYFWHGKEFPKALLFCITIMTTIGMSINFKVQNIHTVFMFSLVLFCYLQYLKDFSYTNVFAFQDMGTYIHEHSMVNYLRLDIH